MALLRLDRAQRNRARRSVGRVLLKTVGPSLLRGLARTWRIEVDGGECPEVPSVPSVQSAPTPGQLVCMWHGRMLIGAPVFADQGYRVLVSASDDGDLSQELLLASGYKVLRGSSSRGGARALREMLALLRGGERIVITPDGPRGPRHAINPGLAWMARATGFPIRPLGLVADRAWRMNSWDRFTIPKPRARVIASWGEPLWLERDADRETVRRVSETLRARTLELEQRAFARLGAECDW